MNSVKTSGIEPRNRVKSVKDLFWFLYTWVFRYQVNKSFGTGENLYLKQRFGFINAKFEPVRCDKCGSTEFIDTERRLLPNHSQVITRTCKKCKNPLGKSVLGHWTPIQNN